MASWVWTMPESQVFHRDPDCVSLRRYKPYFSPRKEREETARRRYPGHRRPCRLCGDDDE